MTRLRSRQNTPVRGATSDGHKPAYSIPSMRDVARIPYNGRRVVSLFSGAGGSSLGYRLAGFRVVYANEFIEAARDTYSANFPETIIDPRDIRDIDPGDILRQTGMRVGDLDILDGSPPCASFSTAGSREQSWNKEKAYSDTVQRTDDLFFEYARIVKGVQPRVFVAENVSGLVKGVSKGYFIEIKAMLEAAGYRVAARMLNAKWLGVPQTRDRLIFVGVRNDLNADPVHPKPLPYMHTVADALPYVIEVRGSSYIDQWFDARRAVIPTITVMGFSTTLKLWFSSGGYITVQNPDATTTRRKIDAAELRALSSFPADFVLTGTPQQQWERVARSVPPYMMMHVAATIDREIFQKARSQ